MPRAPTDNRMAWIRSEERLLASEAGYFSEVEIASEQRITGVFSYGDNFLLAGLYQIEKDATNGLYHYLLKMRFPPFEGYDNLPTATRHGYYFKEGMLGEILCLLSLHFRSRFYLVSTIQGELTPRGLRTKIENEFLYKKSNPVIHPHIFEQPNKTFARWINEFFDSVKNLDTRYHQQFILACHHYQRALKEVGVDSEMVFIRLVSAVEILSQDEELDSEEDVLENTNITKLLEESDLTAIEKEELKKVFDVRKSGKKFVRFIERNCSGYFKGGNYRAKHTKIKKENLGAVLKTIYQARSDYLHSGEPMYLSMVMHGANNWDTDPSMGMTIDNRNIPESKKMPYTFFFEGLVRHCLLNFLRKNQREQE